MSLPDSNRVFGLIVDAAKTAFHGYPCREGTLLQYGRTPIARARTGEVVKIVGPAAGHGAGVHRAADRRHLRLVPDGRADVGRLPVLAPADHRAQVAGPRRRGRQRLGAGPDAGGRGQPGRDAGGVVLRAARALGRTRRRDRERPPVPGRARLRASLPPPQHPGTHADARPRRSAARATARSCCGRATRWPSWARRVQEPDPTVAAVRFPPAGVARRARHAPDGAIVSNEPGACRELRNRAIWV